MIKTHLWFYRAGMRIHIGVWCWLWDLPYVAKMIRVRLLITVTALPHWHLYWLERGISSQWFLWGLYASWWPSASLARLPSFIGLFVISNMFLESSLRSSLGQIFVASFVHGGLEHTMSIYLLRARESYFYMSMAWLSLGLIVTTFSMSRITFSACLM